MQNLENYKQKIDELLSDKKKPWYELFNWAETKTGVPKNYIFIGLVAIIALYLAFGIAGGLLCNIIAVAYPAYISIKAIETPDTRDDTKWLTYWVVYAAFSIVEFFSSIIVQIIPFYWLLKCVFYLWCFVPIGESSGASIIYRRFLRPYVLKHEKAADDLIGKAMGNAKDIVGNVLKKD